MRAMRRRAEYLLLIGLMWPAFRSEAQDLGSLREADIRFFESRVRPILVERCYACHGETKQEGELRLDRHAGLLRGGVSGPVLVPGKPDESLLLAAVRYQNEELQMPPKGKLPESEIQVLQEWIMRGVPHPESAAEVVAPRSSIDLEEGRRFWAFQPPAAAPLPEVHLDWWSRNPVDRFLVAELDAAGLRPSPPADKLTWLRRVTLDLTGLPPTPQEIDEFVSAAAPNAAEQVIERLLSSPRYGERWGRHWLDVVRYADSNGSDENVAFGNAWRYRDYVIAAWNRDKPFDQFAREQLAGDLLPAESDAVRNEQRIATGFLSLGAKVLAEVDERKMEMDIVDEQIDTFGRAFLGLTLGCARCHDHKFDPLRTDDYYALAGIFQSTRTMENFKKVARWHETVIATPEELAAKAAFDQQVAEKKAAIQRAIAAATQALGAVSPGVTAAPNATKAKLEDASAAEEKFPEATKAELKQLRDALSAFEKSPPRLSSSMGAEEGAVIDAAVCLRGSHLTPGKVVSRGVPAVLEVQPLTISATQSGRIQLAEWLTGRHQPLFARVLVNRVWRWHFGRGFVESTENFGKMGDRPTNQALLDWLAVWFMEHGWSVKELHRLIVSSAVYAQTSQADSRSVAVSDSPPLPSGSSADPENRLLGRFPTRRLEAEEIRDSLLMVSGQLDESMGGSLLHVGNREYLFDHTSKDNTKYDSRKRTVYLPVIRNNLYDLYQLFDGTDATSPSGDRATSTVATQALFLLNGPLMLDSARSLANSAFVTGDNDEARLRWLWPQTLGRPATDEELRQAEAFLVHYPERASARATGLNTDCPLAWVALCQVLLASNEFAYVR